jgi:hypothetical protein
MPTIGWLYNNFDAMTYRGLLGQDGFMAWNFNFDLKIGPLVVDPAKWTDGAIFAPNYGFVK